MNCPKCEGAMELGFTPDSTQGGHAMLKNRQSFAVQTMRCSKCGYLESYAK